MDINSMILTRQQDLVLYLSKSNQKVMPKKTLTSFEDLEIWQEAKTLAVMIYGVTSKGNFAVDTG
jgi:hypothetical protein